MGVLPGMLSAPHACAQSLSSSLNRDWLCSGSLYSQPEIYLWKPITGPRFEMWVGWGEKRRNEGEGEREKREGGREVEL